MYTLSIALLQLLLTWVWLFVSNDCACVQNAADCFAFKFSLKQKFIAILQTLLGVRSNGNIVGMSMNFTTQKIYSFTQRRTWYLSAASVVFVKLISNSLLVVLPASLLPLVDGVSVSWSDAWESAQISLLPSLGASLASLVLHACCLMSYLNFCAQNVARACPPCCNYCYNTIQAYFPNSACKWLSEYLVCSALVFPA